MVVLHISNYRLQLFYDEFAYIREDGPYDGQGHYEIDDRFGWFSDSGAKQVTGGPTTGEFQPCYYHRDLTGVLTDQELPTPA